MCIVDNIFEAKRWIMFCMGYVFTVIKRSDSKCAAFFPFTLTNFAYYIHRERKASRWGVWWKDEMMKHMLIGSFIKKWSTWCSHEIVHYIVKYFDKWIFHKSTHYPCEFYLKRLRKIMELSFTQAWIHICNLLKLH